MKQFVFEFVIDYELKIRTIWPPRLPNILKISFDNAEWLLLLFQLYDCCCCFRCCYYFVGGFKTVNMCHEDLRIFFSWLIAMKP